MLRVPYWLPWCGHRFQTRRHHYVAVIHVVREHRQNKHQMKTTRPFRRRRCLCFCVAKQMFVDTMRITSNKCNEFNLPHSKSRYLQLLSSATCNGRVIVSCGCPAMFTYHQVSKHDVFDTSPRSFPTPTDREFTRYRKIPTGRHCSTTKPTILPRQTSPAGINHAAGR
jgi:hypothetical protein